MPIYGGEYLSDDYHTYGVEMDHGQVRYYFDGMQYMSLNINCEGKEFAFGDMSRYIIINNSTKGDGRCLTETDWGVEDEYVTQVDYVRCYLENGEMTGGTEDLTTDASTQLSSGIKAVPTHNYWDLEFPTDIKPDGSEGAAAEIDSRVYIYDPRTNETLRVIDIHPYERPMNVEYSPDGSRLAVATNGGCILIFDTSDYDSVPIKIHNGATIQENVLFSSDSSELIVGGYNGGSASYKNPVDGGKTEKWCFRVFDVSTGAVKKEINLGSDPRFIALSDDGTTAAVTTTSNGIFLYNTSDWSEYLHITQGHDYAIRCADFSSDGKLLVTSDEDGKVNIWNLVTETLLRTIENVNTSSVRRLLFSPDDKYVLCTASTGAARLFSAETGRLVSLLGGFDNSIFEIKYSPDGKYIVIASYDCTVKLFTADGTYLETLLADNVNEQGYIASKLRFAPDSSYVLCATHSRPRSLQKWMLPQEVDKTQLVKALARTTLYNKNYEYAVTVSKLKYAKPAMVDAAYSGIVLRPDIAFDEVSVSLDAENYGDSATVSKGGYIFLKTKNYTSNSDISVVVTDTSDNSQTLIAPDKDNLLSETIGDVYYSTERVFKLYMNDAGTFTVGLTDNRTGKVMRTVNVTVDGTKTATDDFLYSISGGEATILACVSGESDVNIPENIEGYPVTTIGDYALSRYGKIISHMTLSLPSTLKTINKYAFFECCSMRVLNLPEGLTTIGDSAFRGSRLIGDVKFPDSIISIGSNSFRQCSGIESVTLGAGCKIYADSSYFPDTNRIRSVVIGSGVEKVTASLFSQQYLLERVYVPRSVTSLSQYMFSGQTEKIKVFGYADSYAKTFAESYPAKYTFVELKDPVISGVEDGATYDVYTSGAVAATWDDASIAYLNGKKYASGTKITTPGEYTLKVVNGYDEFATEISFTVVDSTPLYTLGDIDDDGDITVADAIICLRAVIGMTQLDEIQRGAADVDKDGEITVSDVLICLRAAAGLLQL